MSLFVMLDSKEAIRNEINQWYPKAEYKTRKSVYGNIRTLRDVGKEYGKNKKLFIKATKNRNKENWKNAKDKYEEFMRTLYPLDIDTISEYSTICMHYVDYEENNDEKEKIIEDGIKHRFWASMLEKDSLSHKIKLGQHYRVHKKNEDAIKLYKELIEEETDYKKILGFRINLHAVYLEESSNPQGSDKNLKELEENFKEIKKLEDQVEVKKQIMDMLEGSMKRIKNADEIDSNDYKSLFRNPKDNPADSSLKEVKWGVLLYLKINGKAATAGDIKTEWLVNSETTKNILEQMVKEGHLSSIPLTKNNTAYQITKSGIDEIEDLHKTIKEILKTEKKKIKEWINMGIKEMVKDDEYEYAFSRRFLTKIHTWEIDKK